MRKDTHGEFITGKVDGKPFSAFIDGVPDKCQHDDKGEELSFNDAGEYFKASEIPNHEINYDAWIKFQDEHKIRGGCVSCSKCGKPFEPDMFGE
jgi:hypothetical protein